MFLYAKNAGHRNLIGEQAGNIQKLRQDVAGQLGMFCRKMAAAGVNMLVLYSDHSNQLIVVVDDYKKGKEVSGEWMQEWWG